MALKSFVYATPSLRPFGFGSSIVARLAPVALGRTDDAARAGVAAAAFLAGVGAAVFFAGDVFAVVRFFAGAFGAAAALALFGAAADVALFAGALLAGEPLAVDLVAVEFLAVFFAGGLGAADAADLEVR